mgnify:CR=1 FL=1|jgi:hypothetical protein
MSEQNMIKPEIHEAIISSLQEQRDRALNEAAGLKAELIILQNKEKDNTEQNTNVEKFPKDKK